MTYQRVLDFWFIENKKSWFEKSEAFDQKIKTEFLSLYEDIRAGKKEDWSEHPKSLLAKIIVLDQFSRNMFRNDKKSFEADHDALVLAKKAVLRGFDKELSAEERVFVYLPFEHSESLSDQEDSVNLFTKLQNENGKSAQVLDYAIQHYKIIKRFNRFPHRNKVLGRESTSEELEFLKEAGSSF